MALRYLGDGKYIQNIPAQDLSTEECVSLAQQAGISLAEFEGAMIASRLYKYADAPKKATKEAASETIEEKDGE